MRVKHYCSILVSSQQGITENAIRQHFNTLHKHHVTKALLSLIIEEKIRPVQEASNVHYYKNQRDI